VDRSSGRIRGRLDRGPSCSLASLGADRAVRLMECLCWNRPNDVGRQAGSTSTASGFSRWPGQACQFVSSRFHIERRAGFLDGRAKHVSNLILAISRPAAVAGVADDGVLDVLADICAPKLVVEPVPP
jgi:hypothetical protein